MAFSMTYSTISGIFMQNSTPSRYEIDQVAHTLRNHFMLLRNGIKTHYKDWGIDDVHSIHKYLFTKLIFF